MFKSFLSNIFLSKVDIGRVKYIFENTPVLNALYKGVSQFLIDYNFPTHLFIETTRACNLSCEGCPRPLQTGQIGHMKMSLFKKIIDESSRFGRRSFCLHMFGEPLLHPDIAEMVKYIKDVNKRHAVLLTTNGYFLNGDKAKAMIENNVDKISVSFFSLKKDRLEKLTGRSDISVVIDNIKNIAKLDRLLGKKTKIFVRFLMDEKNMDELNDFKNLAHDLGVFLELRKTHNYSGVIKNNYTAKVLKKRRYPCYHLWFSPAITWDGKLVICCADWNYWEVLGDVSNNFIESLWKSDRVKNLRKLHLSGRCGEIALCKECNIWASYPDVFFKFQKCGRNS